LGRAILIFIRSTNAGGTRATGHGAPTRGDGATDTLDGGNGTDTATDRDNPGDAISNMEVT